MSDTGEVDGKTFLDEATETDRKDALLYSKLKQTLTKILIHADKVKSNDPELLAIEDEEERNNASWQKYTGVRFKGWAEETQAEDPNLFIAQNRGEEVNEDFSPINKLASRFAMIFQRATRLPALMDIIRTSGSDEDMQFISDHITSMFKKQEDRRKLSHLPKINYLEDLNRYLNVYASLKDNENIIDVTFAPDKKLLNG